MGGRCERCNRSGSAGRRGKDEQLLNELIFRQDLNEVHILIDFLSGRNNRSLQSLSMPNPTIRAK